MYVQTISDYKIYTLHSKDALCDCVAGGDKPVTFSYYMLLRIFVSLLSM